MTKSKKIILFSTIFVIVLVLFIYLIMTFVHNYKLDRKKANAHIENINKDYELFIKNCNKFSELANNFYSNDLYLEDVKDQYDDNLKKLDEISENLYNTKNSSQYLKSNCTKEKNINSDIKTKCNTYKITYKNLLDTYNTIIDDYNKYIDSYNDYIVDKNLEPLKKYERTTF